MERGRATLCPPALRPEPLYCPSSRGHGARVPTGDSLTDRAKVEDSTPGPLVRQALDHRASRPHNPTQGLGDSAPRRAPGRLISSNSPLALDGRCVRAGSPSTSPSPVSLGLRLPVLPLDLSSQKRGHVATFLVPGTFKCSHVINYCSKFPFSFHVHVPFQEHGY